MPPPRAGSKQRARHVQQLPRPIDAHVCQTKLPVGALNTEARSLSAAVEMSEV